MKIISYAFCISLAFLLLNNSTEAQFLKKLKDKVNNTVSGIAGDHDSGTAGNGHNTAPHEQQANNSPAAAPVKATAAAARPAFDFEKHGITVTNAASTDHKKGEYFMEAYSGIQSRGAALIATVVVGVMTEKERLSELGEGSGKDIAYIYENGGEIKETTVGALDKSLIAINRQYDYPYGIDLGANTQELEQYLKKGVGKNKLQAAIVFNGKTYGPYYIVNNMVINKARTKFYALVANMTTAGKMEYSLVSSDGKAQRTGSGGDILVNQNFSNACITVDAGTVIAEAMIEEENETKKEALQKQLTDAMTHPGSGTVMFIDGSTFKNIFFADGWLDQSGKNIFSHRADDGTYLNGKKIVSENVGKGQAWCNAGATQWAYTKSDYQDHRSASETHLIFSDGTDVPGVIHPRQIAAGEKTYMVWYTYDHTRSDNILSCSKAL